MADQAKYINKLKESRVLVIGGSSGMGYAVVEALIENGAHVVVASSKISRVESTISALKKAYPSRDSHITGHACDLSDPETVEKNIRTLFERAGNLNHVVFTAGDALAPSAIRDFSMERVQKSGQVRFFAPLLVAKYAAQNLPKSTKSSITFTGGVSADQPMEGYALVSAFAAGIEGAARGLAVDLKPMRVNVVRPGLTDTNLYAAAGVPDEVKAGIFAGFRQRLPLARVGKIEDLAEAYLYLMKDENVTGELVNSNGGQLLI